MKKKWTSFDGWNKWMFFFPLFCLSESFSYMCGQYNKIWFLLENSIFHKIFVNVCYICLLSCCWKVIFFTFTFYPKQRELQEPWEVLRHSFPYFPPFLRHCVLSDNTICDNTNSLFSNYIQVMYIFSYT